MALRRRRDLGQPLPPAQGQRRLSGGGGALSLSPDAQRRTAGLIADSSGARRCGGTAAPVWRWPVGRIRRFAMKKGRLELAAVLLLASVGAGHAEGTTVIETTGVGPP